MQKKFVYRALDAISLPLPSGLWSGHTSKNRHRIAYVSGSPRTGTTWVTEMVEDIAGCRRIFEPCKGFFQKHKKEFGSRVIGSYTPHIGSGYEEENMLAAYLDGISKGDPPPQAARAFDPSRSVLENLHRIRWANCTLLKFTKIQRCIPWMSFNINIPGVMIFRNPLSTVNSMMRNAPAGYIAESFVLRFSDALLDVIPELSMYQGEPATRLERLTVMACVDMLVPLRSALGPYRPIVVGYEDLCERPELFNDLVSKLGFNIECPDRFHMSAGKPSSTTEASSNVLSGADPRIGWKRSLMDDEVNTIISISERLGVDFYSDFSFDWKKIEKQGFGILG